MAMADLLGSLYCGFSLSTNKNKKHGPKLLASVSPSILKHFVCHFVFSFRFRAVNMHSHCVNLTHWVKSKCCVNLTHWGQSKCCVNLTHWGQSKCCVNQGHWGCVQKAASTKVIKAASNSAAEWAAGLIDPPRNCAARPVRRAE